LVDYDLGHTWTTSTTVGSITFEKLDGKTTTVNGPVTLNATSGATLSLYKLAGNTNSSSVVTKTGDGTLKLMGGTPSGGWIGNWQINAGTLFVNTTSSGALGSNNAVVMNGGNLLFSKGVGSSGTYSGHGQDTALSVQAEATITLDPNPLTPAGANTVSFTNLNIGTQTLHIVKGNSTKSSATDVGYTDPQLSFRTASLTGQATLDVAANVETVMLAGSGSGGVTKIGAGKLTLSSNPSIYAATATTTLNGDAVSDFTITYAGNPSFPYQSAPTVTISAPTSGTQATATATIANGLVTGLTIVNPGSGYTVPPTVSIAGPGVPNSYSGPTTVDSGTLALSGSSASSITIGSSGILEMALVTSNSPTTTGSLRFNSGAKVRPVGTPTDASYTLVTSALITGNPTLEAPIPGYVLVKEGNSLKLNAGSANTAPVITAAQGFSVAENAALATVVGTVVATDADANSTLSGWTIVSGNTGSAFAINSTTGQITLAGALNYEGTSSYSLGVTVSDGTATSGVGTVVVTVTNITEYSDFFGSSSPTADDNGDGISNLMAYALGATSPSSVVLPPALNTADPTKLTITALIRINDPKVSVVGIYGLTQGTWVTGSPITGVPSSSQSGAVAGVTQRQDFSVPRGTDSKKFIYLKATQNP
jgi:autotransporter-associated beta strand protein